MSIILESMLVLLVVVLLLLNFFKKIDVRQARAENIAFYGAGYRQALIDEGYPEGTALRRAKEVVSPE